MSFTPETTVERNGLPCLRDGFDAAVMPDKPVDESTLVVLDKFCILSERHAVSKLLQGNRI
jgi:hypothetical protein